ncbi:MAG: DNA-formamidopyrimidine glycosylase [Thermanaeromonas sp.]|uniref:DNA-formamidopyrimidine glycosylase n=1 Tax=Thermanaeromonas sp. TaxID=2003697 RepID=UPI00243E95D5|nr:DNA-formamidopyrimidine glycosylase [Thermanaeromonas sp.]MCG0277759.1 DNA-formamidopyrimidine glycosylase [Thermanaeromonas sp.]
MPELPEVETVRRTLEPLLKGRAITEARVLHPSVVRGPEVHEFSSLLPEKKVIALERRGKYLLWSLSEGYTLIWHLGMTGRLLWVERPEGALEPHTHVIITFSNGGQVRFVDVRRFGRCYLGHTEEVLREVGVKDLGVEPLSPEFTVERLAQMTRSTKRRIKEVLMDQHCIAGLGNIYSDEALFQAGLHPLRPASSLSEEEIERLHRAIRGVLEAGISHGGTSFRDYVNGLGQRGNHQDYLAVYGKKGEPCPRCGKAIETLKVGGRTSYFCSRCQV